MLFFFYFIFYFFILFLNFWLPWVFIAVRGLSLVAVSVAVYRLLIAVASLVAEHRLQEHGLQ